MLEFELVIPAYNEAKSLPNLLSRVYTAATAGGLTPETFQLVIVQNGSRDNSDEVLEDLQKGELGSWFRVVKVENNRGYGFGILSGLKTTTAPFIGWSHADLQCDPSDALSAFRLAQQEPKNTLVKGVRNGRNWKDKIVSRVFDIIASLLLGFTVYEINAQPKVFNRELLHKLQDPPFNFALDLYVLYHARKAGFELKTLEVLFPPRIHGFSNWSATFFGRYKTILGMIRYMWRLQKIEGRIK